MKLKLTVRGGMLPFQDKSQQVDVDDLPPELGERVRKELNPKRLAELARTPVDPNAADMQTIEITVEDDDGHDTVELPQGAVPPECLDLIDELFDR